MGIEVFETGRKRLANRFVVRARRRRSSALHEILRDRNRSSALVLAASKKKKGGDGNLDKTRRNAISVAKRRRKRFDSARSRRGSSFVDDYNVNDTLFFDGEEANQAVSDDEDELAMDVAVDAVDDDQKVDDVS